MGEAPVWVKVFVYIALYTSEFVSDDTSVSIFTIIKSIRTILKPIIAHILNFSCTRKNFPWLWRHKMGVKPLYYQNIIHTWWLVSAITSRTFWTFVYAFKMIFKDVSVHFPDFPTLARQKRAWHPVKFFAQLHFFENFFWAY